MKMTVEQQCENITRNYEKASDAQIFDMRTRLLGIADKSNVQIVKPYWNKLEYAPSHISRMSTEAA